MRATMIPVQLLLPLTLALLSVVNAQSCNPSTPCPASLPCCSEFGFCGSAEYCLGGCNPMASNSLSSCSGNPICKNANYTFPDPNFPRILTNASYWDGNSTTYDWVLDQGEIIWTKDSGGELILTLSKENGGTRVSSTSFIHYGKITARVKTGRWIGVVSAFITMSNVKDEIDWEWPGANITQAQTNYFWQGVRVDPPNGKIVDGLSDTYANYHDYTIDWKPDQLIFSIDGQVVQTINEKDTYKDGVSNYPNTPSRIQLSLWPAGIASSAQGTIQWAGGMIDWTDPDYIAAGHFFMRFNSISVQCYDSPPAGATSYRYGSNSSDNTPTVNWANGNTVLGSSGAVVVLPVWVFNLLGLGMVVMALAL